VGPRAGLDTEDRGKILCPCRGTEKRNPQILVKMPAADVTMLSLPQCEDTWVAHLQLLDQPGSRSTSDGTCEVLRRRDKFLAERHKVSDEQATSSVKCRTACPTIALSFFVCG
jgi:hypothetical protein